MERLLLKPEEAGALLGVGRSKVYALIASGALPGVRVGASVRVPRAALEQWVTEQSAAQGRGSESGENNEGD